MKNGISAFILNLLLASSVAFAGQVTGSVQFTGTAPAGEVISMAADPYCMTANPGEVVQEAVVVNDNGTLMNVFVYVKEGLEGATFDVPKTAVIIDQEGCMYKPHVFGIQTGQDLQIVNSDSTLHNVHSLAENSKQFNLGMPIKGMKLKKKFQNSEVMAKFKCDVHPWMSAFVGVVDHPYFATSGADGSFSINDLPAGDYTLEAWHETYGTQTQSVTVGDGAAEVSFTFSG